MKKNSHFRNWVVSWRAVLLYILPIVAIVVGPVAYGLGHLEGVVAAMLLSLSPSYHVQRVFGLPSGIAAGVLIALTSALAFPLFGDSTATDRNSILIAFLISGAGVALLGGIIVQQRDTLMSLKEFVVLLVPFTIGGFAACYFLLRTTITISLLAGPSYAIVYALGLNLGKWLRPAPWALKDLWPYLRAMSLPLSGFAFVYFVMSFIFASYYWALYAQDHCSFDVSNQSTTTFLDFLYFSIVTIATVGYGDITPVSQFARMLAIVEIVLGVGWITVGFAAVIAFLQSRFKRISREPQP